MVQSLFFGLKDDCWIFKLMNVIVENVFWEFFFDAFEGGEMRIFISFQGQESVVNIDETIDVSGNSMSRHPQCVGLCVDAPYSASS